MLLAPGYDGGKTSGRYLDPKLLLRLLRLELGLNRQKIRSSEATVLVWGAEDNSRLKCNNEDAPEN